MTTPYVGEIRMFGGSFPPQNWAFCNGQILPINNNETLFALIGTTYGGDGQTTFGLPDLRGRIPMGYGQGPGLSNRTIGEAGGTEQVTLSTINMPPHNHSVQATGNPGSLPAPTSQAVPASPQDLGSVRGGLYLVPGTSAITPVAMAPTSIGVTGGSQQHENRMPSLAVNFIIARNGIFPTRN